MPELRVSLICLIFHLMFHFFLNADFTFIHSKFLAPLPPTIDEFIRSLRLVFPCVLDVSHLMNVIGPLRKVNNIPVAISYLNNHFFAPVDIEVSHQGQSFSLFFFLGMKSPAKL